MLLVLEIIGDVRDARFAERAIDSLRLDSAEATKRRLRRRTEGGIDVAIDLERGSYLFDGAVLEDNGERIVAIQRKPEPAMVVKLSDDLDRLELLRQAVRLGNVFGNQHVPLEVEDGEIQIPITTSREIAAQTVENLGLTGASVSFRDVPFGCEQPLVRYGH